MMDMLSTGVATTLLVVALLAAALGFIAMRVLGAREVSGDHPSRRPDLPRLPSGASAPQNESPPDTKDRP